MRGRAFQRGQQKSRNKPRTAAHECVGHVGAEGPVEVLGVGVVGAGGPALAGPCIQPEEHWRTLGIRRNLCLRV